MGPLIQILMRRPYAAAFDTDYSNNDDDSEDDEYEDKKGVVSDEASESDKDPQDSDIVGRDNQNVEDQEKTQTLLTPLIPPIVVSIQSEMKTNSKVI